jgi:hypothetical protein
VEAPEFALADEDITVTITPAEETRHAIHLAVTSENGTLIDARTLRPSRSTTTAPIDGLGPGAYTIDVSGEGPISPFAPVSSDILIWATPDP